MTHSVVSQRVKHDLWTVPIFNNAWSTLATNCYTNLQVESCLGGRAEVGALHGAHDVGVTVDEPHELF